MADPDKELPSDKWHRLYFGLRQALEDIAFPLGDPRRGGRTEAEIVAEIKRRAERPAPSPMVTEEIDMLRQALALAQNAADDGKFEDPHGWLPKARDLIALLRAPRQGGEP